MAHVTMNREIVEKAVKDIKEGIDKVSNLNHRNILRLIDYSINPPLLVYELADGSLADYDELDLEEILLTAIQSSEALKYVHSRGLVHGDSKPSNILVSKGVVKIGDLSSLTLLLRKLSGSKLSRFCTPGYCAPEQVFSNIRRDERFKGCENKVDIYQLGNVILSMPGIKTLDGSAWSEKELNDRLSKVDFAELRELLKTMMQLEPWKRPTAEEVQKSLVAIWIKMYGTSVQASN